MSYLYENHQPGHQKYSGMLHNGLWHTLSGQGTGYNIGGANRLIGEVVQSRKRPLLGPSPG